MQKCNKVRFARALITASLLVSSNALLFAQERSPAPDNTKVNKRDRAESERTADQAKNTLNDREIMQKIRKAVVADKSLSTYAHNIKIISEHGKVTLKGPVRSQQEKESVEAKAVEVAGSGNVANEITVKDGKNGSKKRS